MKPSDFTGLSPLEAAARALEQLDFAKKPFAAGVHGQMLGEESYRLVANGRAFEALLDAAELLRVADRAKASPEPVAWHELLKSAEAIVRGKPTWKRFIDGTPLANDVPVWMAAFAQEHLNPHDDTHPPEADELLRRWLAGVNAAAVLADTVAYLKARSK